MAVKRVTGPEDYQILTTDTKPTGVPEGSTCTVLDFAAKTVNGYWRYHNGAWYQI